MPVLDDWFPVIVDSKTEELALLGTVVGHPRLRDGRLIVTSNVVVLNLDADLSLSRWYRLRDRSAIARLLDRKAVSVRPGIRQASEAQVQRMAGKTRLNIQEATCYLVKAGLVSHT